MTNQTALSRPPTKMEMVRDGLQGIAGSIVDALPSTMVKYLTPERIIKMTALEVGRSPLLLECTMPSILRAAVDAASLGLEIGSTIGQAYLVPYRNGKTGKYEAQLIVGYQGYIALANRSGELKTVDADIVYSTDSYEILKGTDTKLVHRPNMEKPPGDPLFAYCVAEFTNGGKSLTLMRKDQIEKVRKSSRAGDKGPWSQWPGEMWKKTVIKRARKKWPVSIQQIDQAAALENEAEGGGITVEMAETLDAARGQLDPKPDRTDRMLEDIKNGGDGPTAEAMRAAAVGRTPATGAYPPPDAAQNAPVEPSKAPQELPAQSSEGEATALTVQGLTDQARALNLPPEVATRIFEDHGITPRTRSQKKLDAVRVALLRASMPSKEPDWRSDNSQPQPGDVVNLDGQTGVISEDGKFVPADDPTRPFEDGEVIDAEFDPKEMAQNGQSEAFQAPEPDPGGPADSGVKPLDVPPDMGVHVQENIPKIDQAAADEIRKLILTNGLASDESGIAPMLRWASGDNEVNRPEDLDRDQASQVFKRLDMMIKAAR